MGKLLRGEIYRLTHKRSMYIYFAALIAGYLMVVFVRSGGFDADSVVSDAMTFFYILPALAGGYLFAAIFTDDLNSKNLITLVGYGLSKTTIVLTKFLLGVLCAGVFYALLAGIHCGMYTLLGATPTSVQSGWVFAVALKYFLMTVAFFALSSIVVYAIQRTTFALVTYLLFGFNVITTLITAVSKIAGLNVGGYVVSGLTDKIFLGVVNGNVMIAPLLGYLCYLIIALVLAAVAFTNKEMEF